MAFTTQLQVSQECSETRLRSLVKSLQRFDCVVRLEPPDALTELRSGGGRLLVRVPADGYTWIIRGGFGALIDEYADVVRWRAPFDDLPNHAGHTPALPDEPPRR